MKSKIICQFIVFLFILVLAGCSTGSRMEKKMLSRLSANEIEAASGYIYPEDQAAFAFFVDEVLPLCDNVYFEAEKIETERNIDGKTLQIRYRIHNYNKSIINYFHSIGKNITPDGMMMDTVRVVSTKEGDKISFSWGIPNVNNANLRWARLPEDATIESMNVRIAPNKKATIIGSLQKGQRLMIDNASSADGWVHAYWLYNDGTCAHGYIKADSLTITKHSTYSPSIFDSFVFLLSVLVISVLFAVFLLPMLFESGGCILWCVSIFIILGLIYVVYEFFEKLLFELFIINIPY